MSTIDGKINSGKIIIITISLQKINSNELTSAFNESGIVFSIESMS